jgi:hypothetical protein
MVLIYDRLGLDGTSDRLRPVDVFSELIRSGQFWYIGGTLVSFFKIRKTALNCGRSTT